MSLTKSQRNELKKISSGFKKLEKISDDSPDSIAAFLEFSFPDESEFRRDQATRQNSRRREIFQSAGKRKKA